MLSLSGGLSAPFLLRNYTAPLVFAVAALGVVVVLHAQHRAIARQRTEITRLSRIEAECMRLSNDIAAADEVRRALEARVNAADRLIAERLVAVDEQNRNARQGVKNVLTNRAAGIPGGDSSDLLRELAQIQQNHGFGPGPGGLPDADRPAPDREGSVAPP